MTSLVTKTKEILNCRIITKDNFIKANLTYFFICVHLWRIEYFARIFFFFSRRKTVRNYCWEEYRLVDRVEMSWDPVTNPVKWVLSVPVNFVWEYFTKVSWIVSCSVCEKTRTLRRDCVWMWNLQSQFIIGIAKDVQCLWSCLSMFYVEEGSRWASVKQSLLYAMFSEY